MSNAICIQDQCQSFLMYDRRVTQGYPTADIKFVPFIKETCKDGDQYTVTNYNIDGTPYTETPQEEIIPEDLDYQPIPVCIQGSQMLRWYVTSKGKAMGPSFTYHTHVDGSLTVVSTNATVEFGECGSGDPCDTQPLYHFVRQTGYAEVVFRKKCPSATDPSGYTITYTDMTNKTRSAEDFQGILVLPDELSVHQEIMCSGTTTFVRWFTVQSGSPVHYFDTNLSGAIIDDQGENVSPGACDGDDDQCRTVRVYQINGGVLTLLWKKECPGEEPEYTNEAGAVVTLTGDEIFPEDVDIEQEVMCDGSTDFIRSYVHVKTDPTLNFSYDMGLDGDPYTVTSAQIRLGKCTDGDPCTMLPYYAVNAALKQTNPYRVKFCPGQEPIYFDKNNLQVPKSSISGTLIPASDIDIEHVIMCDGSKTFQRRYVNINSGQHMNFHRDTLLDSTTSYTPLGTVKFGRCYEGDDCETLVYYAVDPEDDDEKIKSYRVKFCPGEEPVYYDSSNQVTPEGDITGSIVPAEDVSAEQQVMCDGTDTFIRWYVAVRGEPAFFHDTNLEGGDFTPAGDDISVGACSVECCPCETERFYHFEEGELKGELKRFLKTVCPGEEPIYTDLTGGPIPTPPSEHVYYPEDVNLHQQFMCANNKTFIRWYTGIEGVASGLYYDTNLDGGEIDAQDADAVTPGICPDCMSAPEYEDLCDVDNSTVQYVNMVRDNNSDGGAFGEVLDGVAWTAASEYEDNKFRFEDAIAWEFTETVNVEFVLEYPGGVDSTLVFDQPVKMKGSPDGVTFANQNTLHVVGPQNNITILAENLQEIMISADYNRWYISKVTVYFPLPRAPIPFRRKTVIDCDGLPIVEYVDQDGNPYEVQGDIEECI